MSEASPRVIIIGGPNGAGKTTLAPFLLRDTFGLLEFVNADTISVGLSAFNPEGVAFEAGRLMIRRLHELTKNEQSFAFESTLATRSYGPWLHSLVEADYEFHLVFLSLRSVELAIERVAERVRGGGHQVSEQVVRRRYLRGLANLFDVYIPLADTWSVYDNSGSGSPVLVATGDHGRQKVVMPDLWQILREAQQ
jgi:predicted ABC-type ATPase